MPYLNLTTLLGFALFFAVIVIVYMAMFISTLRRKIEKREVRIDSLRHRLNEKGDSVPPYVSREHYDALLAKYKALLEETNALNEAYINLKQSIY